MAKRKRSKSPKRQQAETEAASLPSPALARQCYMFTLPDDILSDILLWTRPTDEDQSIWLWLCRVSATCKVFRQLIRLEKKGVARIMPTVFKLVENYYYLNEGPHADSRSSSRPRYGPVSLRVKLMDAVKSSTWMGSHIRSFRADYGPALEDERGLSSMAVVEALKSLPKLVDLRILDLGLIDRTVVLVDERFLRGVAREHSGLSSLYLLGSGHSPCDPEVFATLSVSMLRLQTAGLGLTGFSDQHLSAFIANLNPRLTSLVLDFDETQDEPGDEGFSSLCNHYPDLKSLHLTSPSLTTRQIGTIIRSKRNLVSIDLTDCCRHDWRDKGVIAAIIEMQLRLETFRASYCYWFDDRELKRLLKGLIVASDGKVPLTRLGIIDTDVIAVGARAFLTKWRKKRILFFH